MKATVSPIASAITSLLAFATLAPFVTADEPNATKPDPPKITDKNLHQMEELVKQGADPNAPIYYARMLRKGETEHPPGSPVGAYPLEAAIDTQNSLIVKRILALGAKPQRDELSRAAFIVNSPSAATMAKMLIKAGSDPNGVKDFDSGPPLTSAAFRGHVELVEFLLAQPGIEVDQRDIDGQTALISAAARGHTKIVEILLKAGADPNARARRDWTAADRAQNEIDKFKGIIQRLETAASNKSAKKEAALSPDEAKRLAPFVGTWNVSYSNGIDQVHVIPGNATATASAKAHRYHAVGRVDFEGAAESLSITYADDHNERWTPVGDQMIVEHWDSGSQPGKTVKVVGIGDRAPVADVEPEANARADKAAAP